MRKPMMKQLQIYSRMYLLPRRRLLLLLQRRKKMIPRQRVFNHYTKQQRLISKKTQLLDDVATPTCTSVQKQSSSSDSVVGNGGRAAVADGDEEMFSLDANELVILDNDYLYGDDYKDPELDRCRELMQSLNRLPTDILNKQVTFEDGTSSNTMRSTMRSTLRGDTSRGDTFRGSTMRGDTLRGSTMRGSTMRGDTMRSNKTGTGTSSQRSRIVITTPVPRPMDIKTLGQMSSQTSKPKDVPHLKPKKLQLSVVHSFRKTLTKLNSVMKRTPTEHKSADREREVSVANPEYLKELKTIERAKDITVFDFVS
eukprot:477290_1